jgi:LacI family transcriptional regulator
MKGILMTVKEIATLAGVSIGTVDRVLHGRGRVSAETKAAIEAIVKERGYTPNPIARRLKSGRTYRFSVLIPGRNEDSGYWGQARTGIQGAAEEIRGEGIETRIVEFDRYDAASFRAAAESVVADGPDGVLLAPIMPREALRFTERLDGKIPYVFFDADLPGASPVCGIGQDSYRGGYLAGRLALLFAGAPALFAVVDAHGEDFHIRTRREGFLAYAAERGFPTVVAESVDLEDAAAAEGLIASLRREHPELAGIFVTSASSHRIADSARPLRERGRFVVIGYDLVPENERLLRSGAIDAIISQRPEIQGRRGLLDLYRSIVLGRAVERRVEVPIDLYLKENLPQ